MIKSILACIFVFALHQSGFSSVYLYNNTPFVLKAQVVAANGMKLGEKLLQADQTAYVEDELGTSDPVTEGDQKPYENSKQSMTPYQVFWYCTTGDEALYASCPMVAAGATVLATSCSGPCNCLPPKKEDQAQNAKKSDAYKQD